MSSKRIIHADLVSLRDDFVEFNDYCAFLCDALSALFTEYSENEFDSHTIQGVKRQCGDLKERAEKLESLLNTLYEQSSPDLKIATLDPNRHD